MGCRSGRRCLEALAGLELRLASTGLALAWKAEIGCVAVTGVIAPASVPSVCWSDPRIGRRRIEAAKYGECCESLVQVGGQMSAMTEQLGIMGILSYRIAVCLCPKSSLMVRFGSLDYPIHVCSIYSMIILTRMY